MPGRMHQTTIRFAADTWLKVEQRAEANGVSAAQYVRDATVARIAIELAEIAGGRAQQRRLDASGPAAGFVPRRES